MSRRLILILTLFSSVSLAQTFKDSQDIVASGAAITVANPQGTKAASFEENVFGAPTSTTVIVQGCSAQNSCDQLDSNTITGNGTSVRSVTASSVYDHFLVWASWTGGSGVFVRINSTLSIPYSTTGGAAVWTDDGTTVKPPAGRNVSIVTTLPSSGAVTDSTTARTLAAADNGKVIRFTSASAVTVTVPAGLPLNFSALLIQRGAGAITITAGSGVTAGNVDGTTTTKGAKSVASVICDTQDDCVTAGNLQ